MVWERERKIEEGEVQELEEDEDEVQEVDPTIDEEVQQLGRVERLLEVNVPCDDLGGEGQVQRLNVIEEITVEETKIDEVEEEKEIREPEDDAEMEEVANPGMVIEGKLPKTDFSNILNSTAIEGGNELDLFPQIKIAPITNSALDPKQNLEKVRVEKTPDIEFLEAREVECPDCEKKSCDECCLQKHEIGREL